MTDLSHAKGFWDLLVYQKARQLAKEIHALSSSQTICESPADFFWQEMKTDN